MSTRYCYHFRRCKCKTEMDYDERNRHTACDVIRDHTTALNLSVVDDREESSGVGVMVDTEGHNEVVVEVSCNQNSKNRHISNVK